MFDDDGDGICDQDEARRSDELACNYIPSTTEDGLCDYESCIVEGCMDATACTTIRMQALMIYHAFTSMSNVCGGIGIPKGHVM